MEVAALDELRLAGEADVETFDRDVVRRRGLLSSVTLICNCTGRPSSVSELLSTAVTVGASARTTRCPREREQSQPE